MNLNDLSIEEIERIKMALAIARDRAAQISVAGDHKQDKYIQHFFVDEAIAYQEILSKICE